MKKKAMYLFVAILLLAAIFTVACKKLTSTEFNIDKSACNGCGNCSLVCPADAIIFDTDGRAVIDQSKCTRCSECVAVCPQTAIY